MSFEWGQTPPDSSGFTGGSSGDLWSQGGQEQPAQSDAAWGSFGGGASGGSDRFKVPGFDFQTPDTTFGTPHELLPFRIGSTDSSGRFSGFNPTTINNLWNPQSTIDMLATWGRIGLGALGYDPGRAAANIGQSIADSDFGKAISKSPFAGAANIIGDEVTSTLRGVGQTVGDIFSPVGATLDAIGKGDWATAILNANRAVMFQGLGLKTAERLKGALGGDVDMQQQAWDELSALSLIPIAKGAGLALKGAQASGLVGKALPGAVKTGIQWAKYGMAAGFGGEVGGEIASNWDPQTKALAEQIASQTAVPQDSPFSGIANILPAMLIDPLPMLGKMAEFAPVRAMMDSGRAKLPAYLETRYPGAKFSEDFIKQQQAHALQRVSWKQLSAQGIEDPALIEKAYQGQLDHNTAVLNGKAGLSSDYTSLMEAMRNESAGEEYARIHAKLPNGEFANPQFQKMGISADDFEANFATHQRLWQELKTVGADKNTALWRGNTPMSVDYQNAIDAVNAVGGKMKKPIDADTLNQLIHDHPLIGELGLQQRGKILEALADAKRYAPQEPIGSAPGADVAARARAEGSFRVGYGPSSTTALGPLDVPSVNHPAYREFKQAMGSDFKNFKKAQGGQSLTANDMKDALAKYGKNSSQLDKYLQGHSSFYTRDGSVRPFMRPDEKIIPQMPGRSTQLGRFVAGMREWVPSTALYQDFKNKFFDVHSKAMGWTRAQVEEYDQIITELANSAGKRKDQLMGGIRTGSLELNAAAEKVGGYKGQNMGQLMMQSAPRDTWRDVLGQMLGLRVGKVGAGPSFAAKLRGMGDNSMGDFYRWWTQVGHPGVRYSGSVLLQAALPVENVVNSIVEGAHFAPTDKILHGALNDSLSEFYRTTAGVTGGERYGGGLMEPLPRSRFSGAEGQNVLEGETTSGEPSGPRINKARGEAMAKSMEQQFPERWADRMQKELPHDWALIKTAYPDERAAAIDMMGQRELRKQYLSGRLSDDKIANMAGFHEDKGGFDANAFRQDLLSEKSYELSQRSTNGAGPLAQRIASRSAEATPGAASNEALATANGRAFAPGTGGALRPSAIPLTPLETFEERQAAIAGQVKATAAKEWAAFQPIERQIQGAMRDAAQQAQTTHLSNPMRRYWERSLNGPMLVYPLSWTLKAGGVWAKFLTHSAFGLPTGMAGLVTFNEIKDATSRALAGDATAKGWMDDHPETVKVMQWLMPLSPLGGGMGLMSVPFRDAAQVGSNVLHGRSVDENLSVPWRIGVVRDITGVPGGESVMSKMWSEWIHDKQKTTLARPGL